MHSQIYTVVLLALGLLAAHPIQAQQHAAATVTLTVTDPNGNAIVGADVVLHIRSASAFLKTDERGQLPINCSVGDYSIAASALGFGPASKLISACSATSPGKDFTMVLDPDPWGLQGPTYPKDTLVLRAGSNPGFVLLSVAEFRALPHVTVTVHNAHADAEETYSGVPLAALLAKLDAPLGEHLRGKALASYIVATGSDGYSVVLSIAEADPSFHGGEILVADTRDGQPLGKSGPFQLIVSEDKRPARWVHNLVSISLQDAR
jgi:hypothetical protein